MFKVSYCGRSMTVVLVRRQSSVVWRQQFALKANSSYTPESVDSKRDRKHWGDGVSLTLCCFVVYSTRRFVVCLSVCHFVLVFFSPFSIAITSLGEERANLSAFRTFVRFVLV